MLQAKPPEPGLEESKPESTPATQLLGSVSWSSTSSALLPIFAEHGPEGMIQNKAKSLILQLSNAGDQGTVHVLSDLALTLQTQLKSPREAKPDRIQGHPLYPAFL